HAVDGGSRLARGETGPQRRAHALGPRLVHDGLGAWIGEVPGAEAVVTFNHNYMNPVLALRALVARVGALNVVNIGTGFLQSWLMTDPKIRQSGWRLKDPYGGLTDIGSHAGMLAAWIMGMDIAAVSGVKMSTVGSHGAQCLDNGTLNIHFPNGLNGTSCFHQALPGHVDDLYAVVSFKDGVLPNGFCHAMFRMEWNPDGIFLSKGDGNIDDWAQWKLQVHAPCELITGAELDLRFTPPGHMEGWPEGWRRMFKAIAGHFWTKLGLQFAAPLAGNFALPAPTLATAGEVSMRYIGAVIKAHTEGLGSVALADVK
ncbi:MAG TPA: hypothetical protein PLP17_05455, partial [Oligoflexia bacterium]|nr:hypothetical protein [Oligoflexia bacterium]